MCICEPDPVWETTKSRKHVAQSVQQQVAQPVATYQPAQIEQAAIELDHTAAPQTIQATQPVGAPRQRSIAKAPRQKQAAIVKAPSINWVKGLTVIASTVGKVAGWSLKTTWLVTKATVTIAAKITLPLLKVTGSQFVRAGQSFKQTIANDLNRYQAEMTMRSLQPQPAQPAQPKTVAMPDLSNIGQLKRTAEPVQIPVQTRERQKQWSQ